MAPPERLPDAALIARLAKEGYRYPFFQAVALVEALMPGAVPVGEGGPAADEGIRLRHDPRPIFHASDILSIVPRDVERGRPYTVITSTFLGLLGTVSPLPMHMTETVLNAESSDETSLRGFYDIFHHRILSLLYRAWRKHRFFVGATAAAVDAPTRRLLAMVGVDPRGDQPNEAVPPWLLLRLAPLVAMRARTTRTLRLAMEQLFPGLHVEVDCFAVRRVPLDPAHRMALGKRNTTLMEDLTIGRSVADRSGRFRVQLGPVDNEHFEALAPGGRLYPVLAATIEHFSGGVLECEVELCLADDAVPRFQLSNPKGAMLSRNTRLATRGTAPLRSRFVVGGGEENAAPRILGDRDDPMSTRPHPPAK